MEFIDLKTQYRSIQEGIHRRLQTVLDHGRFIMGPEIGDLEERLAEFTGVKHAVCVSSGTDALLIAMMALGIGRGDEVITSPFSFIASAEMIALLGATPVFVDIGPDTFNLDPNLIERAMTEKTKAIIPVCLYGQCADLDAINAIADTHALPVIEDGAQSFGAEYKGKRSCSLSTIGITSFFPAKPLGCYGDGGACFTNDDELASQMRAIRIHGQAARYRHAVVGVNGRMDTMQAAILLEKLNIFPEDIEARARIGARYTELLQGAVTTPHIAEGNTHVYAQYTIMAPGRDNVRDRLQVKGVPTAVHYPIPLHRQEAFAYLDMPEGSFPNAELAARRVISLPMSPYLTKSDQDVVVKAVLSAVSV